MNQRLCTLLVALLAVLWSAPAAAGPLAAPQIRPGAAAAVEGVRAEAARVRAARGREGTLGMSYSPNRDEDEADRDEDEVGRISGRAASRAAPRLLVEAGTTSQRERERCRETPP